MEMNSYAYGPYGVVTTEISRSQTHSQTRNAMHAMQSTRITERKTKKKKKIDFRSVFWDSPFSWNSFARTADDGSPSQPDIGCVPFGLSLHIYHGLYVKCLCLSIWFSMPLKLNNIGLLGTHRSVFVTKCDRNRSTKKMTCKTLSLGPENIWELKRKKMDFNLVATE